MTEYSSELKILRTTTEIVFRSAASKAFDKSVIFLSGDINIMKFVFHERGEVR